MAAARAALKTLACDIKSVEMELKMKVNKKLCICQHSYDETFKPFFGVEKVFKDCDTCKISCQRLERNERLVNVPKLHHQEGCANGIEATPWSCDLI